MSVHLDADRFYRRSPRPAASETAFQVVVEQSDLWIVAGRDLSVDVARHLTAIRAGLKNYLLLHPGFAASLVPVDVEDDAPPLVRAMARAAAACGVGPMAAVAGAVAQAVADRFVADSPDIVVENGGDVFLHSTRERLVALLAAPGAGARLALRLPPGAFPAALCGSSARIGPSLSFGAADLVTVLASDGALADAAATTLGNLAASPESLPLVVERAMSLACAGVRGVFAQVGGRVAVWGEMELAVLE